MAALLRIKVKIRVNKEINRKKKGENKNMKDYQNSRGSIK